MERNERFDRIRAKHPDWSDEQVWMAVSLDMQQDATINQKGNDINPLDPKIWEIIVEKAQEWLQEVLPVVFEKVKEFFATLIGRLKQWIAEKVPVIYEKITELIGKFSRVY